jgi:PEGA domain
LSLHCVRFVDYATTLVAMNRFCSALLLSFLVALPALAKNEPIVIQWPSDSPVMKLTFEKIREESSYGGNNFYTADVVVENITGKQIPRAYFTVYFFDKNKVRIGQGTLQLADLDAHQSAKMNFQFNSSGAPVAITLLGRPTEKTIPLKIISVPPGAALKVDGKDSGVTPVLVRFTVGSHQLEMTKEGYATGNTPLDVSPDELPGGSITLELGGLSRDTVELRDGTVLLGDVMSMSMTDVTVRVDGKDQSYPRNQVKKIILVEREVQRQPVMVQPATTAK